jgi:4-diphosphocytidyl-2-C-methyl-D-erythritol kinase
MFVERSKNGWVVHAPAKINLALEVLGRRTDGYHQVETLLVPVRLFDTLAYSPSREALQLAIRGARHYSFASLAAQPQDNLVMRAVRRLAEHSGREPTGRLQLFKRIPIEAGMGGGSSDAAAALVAANAAWGLGYTADQLAVIARELGADVPFFIHGGAALGTGRGDQVVRVPLPAGLPIVLVQAPVGLPTAKVFAALRKNDPKQATGGASRCRRLIDCLTKGVPVSRCRNLIRNCLQRPATELCSWIGHIGDAMDKLPVLAHQMTGSGSGYFAVCRTSREARFVASRLRGQPWQYVAATQTCL